MSTPYFQQWSSLRGRSFSGASPGQCFACPPVEDLGFSRGWHCPMPLQVRVLGPAHVLWWGRGGSWQCAPVKAAGPYVWHQDWAGGGWEQRWRCCTTLSLVFWRGRRDGRRMDGVAPPVLWPWGSLQSVLCDSRALWGSGGCHWISSHLQRLLRTWRPTLCRIKLKPTGRAASSRGFSLPWACLRGASFSCPHCPVAWFSLRVSLTTKLPV